MSWPRVAIYSQYALFRRKGQKGITVYLKDPKTGQYSIPYLSVKPGMLPVFCRDFNLRYPKELGEE